MAVHQRMTLFFASLLVLFVSDSQQQDDCPNGDGIFSDGMTCDGLLIRNGPRMCDYGANARVCCQTCKNLLSAGPDDLSGKLIAEGYFVVDRKALDKYLREENGDVKRARTSMRKDIQFYIADANTYYETLKPYGLDIELRIADIQMLDDDVVTESDIIIRKNVIVDSLTIHDRFDNFLRTDGRAKKATQYDFAMLFTGYKLKKLVAGIADPDAMCTWYASGVVVLTGLIDAANTLAHEIGHVFGAGHDPKGARTVMAAFASEKKHPDVFKFSKFSANQIKTYLERKGTSDCLRETKKTSKVASMTPQTYKGKMQDPNTICSRANGEGSTMCLGEEFYGKKAVSGDNVCYNIECKIMSEKGKEGWCWSVKTTEGMICGYQKSCRKGKCLQDSRKKAGNVNPDCIYGDEVNLDGFGETCEQLIAKEGRMRCAVHRDSCCETCKKYETDIPNCPYGDGIFAGNVTCNDILKSVGPGMCDYPSNAEMCCKTCHDLRSGNPITG